MIISVIIALVISNLIFAASYIALKKKASGSLSQEIEERINKIESVIAQTKEKIENSKNLASKAQYESVLAKLEEGKQNLDKERESLKETEKKLDSVQKLVETKEMHHQEMKTSRDDDDNKLTELLESYENISQESIELEQKLAESMKSLDSIMSNITVDESQKAILQELSDTLTNAGTRMRDLLTEYNMVKERLDALKQQHVDLEDEYTRLVEQQLGE